MTVGGIRTLRDSVPYLSYDIDARHREHESDIYEVFFHRRTIFTKNLLTNRIFPYNFITSIGDRRLLARHKNTLQRWTV